MSLKKMELKVNIAKMETGILEKEYQIEKLKEDIQRVKDHIELMQKNKMECQEKLKELEG